MRKKTMKRALPLAALALALAGGGLAGGAALAPQQAHAKAKAPARAKVARASYTAAGTVTVKVRKARRAGGYQVIIGTNRKVTKGVVRTDARGDKYSSVERGKASARGRSCKFRKMPAAEAYWVKARAWRKSGGKRVWGKWSKARKVSCAHEWKTRTVKKRYRGVKITPYYWCICGGNGNDPKEHGGRVRFYAGDTTVEEALEMEATAWKKWDPDMAWWKSHGWAWVTHEDGTETWEDTHAGLDPTDYWRDLYKDEDDVALLKLIAHWDSFDIEERKNHMQWGAGYDQDPVWETVERRETSCALCGASR